MHHSPDRASASVFFDIFDLKTSGLSTPSASAIIASQLLASSSDRLLVGISSSNASSAAYVRSASLVVMPTRTDLNLTADAVATTTEL